MPGGRPPLYETADELETAVDFYFESLKRFDSVGNPIQPRTPTVAGLAYFLGFHERRSLYAQDDRGEEFLRIRKRAVLFIEAFHEENLTEGKNVVGSIFWMKNHNWRDRQEVELSGSVTILDDVPREPKNG